MGAKINFRIVTVSRSSLGLKSVLKMPGLEPGTSQLSMLRECAYNLRYIPVDPSANTHSIAGPDLAGLLGLHLIFMVYFLFFNRSLKNSLTRA